MPKEYIDLTPTWSAVLPIYLAAYCNGTDKGRTAAETELRRMAELADKYNASLKEEKS